MPPPGFSPEYSLSGPAGASRNALRHADLLLTRDRGFYQLAFQDLQVVDPTGGAAAEE